MLKALVVEPLSPLPHAFTASLFVAGAPGPWVQALVDLIGKHEWDGVVLLSQSTSSSSVPSLVPSPVPSSGTSPITSVGASPLSPAMVRWREEALKHTDGLLIWFGDGGQGEPWLHELWGAWQRSSRVLLGIPQGMIVPASAGRFHVPVAITLEDAAEQALRMLRPSRLRRGSERQVPLSLWQSPGFVAWYKALKLAGHRLEDAQLEWSYRSRSAGRPPLLWALRPRVSIAGEHRHKGGEVVIGRTDVSASVLFFNDSSRSRVDQPADVFSTQVVLVREYRSAVRNALGFGLMLPGGSANLASERTVDPRQTAQREVFEETGLQIDLEQFQPVEAGDRQVAASLASYHCHLFRVCLSEDQFRALVATETSLRPHGANVGERCYVTVKTVRELLASKDIDWSQLGMILHALLSPT